MPRHAIVALLAALPCLAWEGGGEGRTDWAAGADKIRQERSTVPLSAAMRADPARDGHLLLAITLPGEGDAVLDLRFDQRLLQGTDLPTPGMEIRYVEYDADGEVAFRADTAEAGRVSLRGSYDNGFSLLLDLDLAERRQGHTFWRTLRGTYAAIDPISPIHAPDEPRAMIEGSAEASAGCDGWDEAPYDPPPTAESGEGCAADDVGESPSGCEADDVSGGGEGCDGGCAGDAMAAHPGGVRRRRGWAGRLAPGLPWLLVLGFIEWRRRRSWPRPQLRSDR